MHKMYFKEQGKLVSGDIDGLSKNPAKFLGEVGLPKLRAQLGADTTSPIMVVIDNAAI